MAAYYIALESDPAGDILRVGFGDLATGDAVMRDAKTALAALEFSGGKLLRVNGPASLPVAMAIAHIVAHRYGAIAVYDPKLSGYIVAISHDPQWLVGEIIQQDGDPG